MASDTDPDISQRLSERQRRLLKARMVHPRHGEIDILVRDVSEQGIGGKCDYDIAAGETVTIRLPTNAPARGRIAWRKGQGFGVQLETGLDPHAVKIALEPPAQGAYQVPDYFQPSDSIKRPGFGRRTRS